MAPGTYQAVLRMLKGVANYPRLSSVSMLQAVGRHLLVNMVDALRTEQSRAVWSIMCACAAASCRARTAVRYVSRCWLRICFSCLYLYFQQEQHSGPGVPAALQQLWSAVASSLQPPSALAAELAAKASDAGLPGAAGWADTSGSEWAAVWTAICQVQRARSDQSPIKHAPADAVAVHLTHAVPPGTG